jgi:hypothetical protein
MGRFIDNAIAYRILSLLVTPFSQTPAYKMGIIDEKGKELRKMSQLNTIEERDAYTLLHRLVFRLKKIIEKVPFDNKRLVSLAAAYSLIRECVDKEEEPIGLELRFINIIETNLNKEVVLVEQFLQNRKMFTFKQFTEEDGGSAEVTSEVPANNAMVTPGIAGLGKDVPVSKKKQKKYTSGNSMFRRNVKIPKMPL